MKTPNTIYVNNTNNISYHDDEILETTINCYDRKSGIIHLILDLFTNTTDERFILSTLLTISNEWTIVSLCKYLSEHNHKSERTYRRAINDLIDNRVLVYNLGKLTVNEDYDINKYDINNVKSIIIHLNPKN